MKTLQKILITSVIALFIGEVFPGITVDSLWTAICISLVIGILNLTAKPLLIILTLPVTILTFGLFLIMINVFIILLADDLIDGFSVSNLWNALLFSFCLSSLRYIITRELYNPEQ